MKSLPLNPPSYYLAKMWMTIKIALLYKIISLPCGGLSKNYKGTIIVHIIKYSGKAALNKVRLLAAGPAILTVKLDVLIGGILVTKLLHIYKAIMGYG